MLLRRRQRNKMGEENLRGWREDEGLNFGEERVHQGSRGLVEVSSAQSQGAKKVEDKRDVVSESGFIVAPFVNFYAGSDSLRRNKRIMINDLPEGIYAIGLPEFLQRSGNFTYPLVKKADIFKRLAELARENPDVWDERTDVVIKRFDYLSDREAA
jgi:hypothetical protein